MARVWRPDREPGLVDLRRGKAPRRRKTKRRRPDHLSGDADRVELRERRRALRPRETTIEGADRVRRGMTGVALRDTVWRDVKELARLQEKNLLSLDEEEKPRALDACRDKRDKWPVHVD